MLALSAEAVPGEGTTVTLAAKRVGGVLEPLDNTAVQQRFRVLIGTAELTASAWASKVPVRTDKLTFAGRVRAVMDARPIKDGDTVGLYELDVVG